MHVQSILAAKGTDVAVVAQTATLADAAQQLRDRGIGALVVSGDGSAIEGIVSERDVVRALAAHGASALGRTVGSTMSTDVVTCTASDPVERLMSLMTERRIRHLPVVDEAGRLAGIISIGDVVKSRLGELENENKALFDYITHGR
ncbi:MAG: CBS domain-containing protein [Ilumatobacteraceae bacterium]|jgi:CBS domain-containing protein|nr:CBS domain-containing protein [Ilumatobacteraceae bacterium]